MKVVFMAKKKTAAQKAWATRRRNAGVTAPRTRRATGGTRTGGVEIRYGHMGNNGIKSGLVPSTATHEEALAQIYGSLGNALNKDKEGIIAKDVDGIESGKVILFKDTVKAGLYAIVPGVDSSNQ